MSFNFGAPNPAPAPAFGSTTFSFGASTAAPAQQPGGLFGQPAAPAPAFGATTAAAPSFSFGAPSTAAPAFGSAAPAPAFGSAAPAAPQFGAGAFGGTAAASAPSFSFGASTTPAAPTSTFGSTTTGLTFGQTAPASTGLFGAAAPAPAATPFGQATTAFGAPAAPASSTPFATNTFGASTFGAPSAFGSTAQTTPGLPAGCTQPKYTPTDERDAQTATNLKYHTLTRQQEASMRSLEEWRLDEYRRRKGLPPSFPQPQQPAASSAFSFGQPAAPTAAPAPAPSTAFSFGQPQATAQPFGAPAATTTAAPSFSFGQPQQPAAPAQPAATNAFSFGSTTTSAFGAPAKPAATPFGAPATTTPFGATTTTAAPSFSFGASTTPAATTAPSTGLFGSTTTATTQPATTGFGFGAPATAAPATAPTTFGGFGTQPAATAPTTSLFGSTPAQPTATTASTGFSFGAPAATATAPAAPTTGFSFGAPAATTAPAAPAPATTGFSFGASTTTTATAAPATTTSFSFGQPAAPAATTTTAAPSFGSFSFGAAQPQATATIAQPAQPPSFLSQPFGVATAVTASTAMTPAPAPTTTLGIAADQSQVQPVPLVSPIVRLPTRISAKARPRGTPGRTPAKTPLISEISEESNKFQQQASASSFAGESFNPRRLAFSTPLKFGGFSARAAEEESAAPVEGRVLATPLAVASSFQPAEQPQEKANARAPKLSKPGYYTTPSIDQLRKMSDEDLKCVQNFQVHRDGCGFVRFQNADVADVDLDEAVEIEKGSVDVYPETRYSFPGQVLTPEIDATMLKPKPAEGQKLNRYAVITLQGVTLPERYLSVPGAADKYRKLLQKRNEESGARFLSWEDRMGEWTFAVDHFTRYGLKPEDLMDETDLDAELSKGVQRAPSPAPVAEHHDAPKPPIISRRSGKFVVPEFIEGQDSAASSPAFAREVPVAPTPKAVGKFSVPDIADLSPLLAASPEERPTKQQRVISPIPTESPPLETQRSETPVSALYRASPAGITLGASVGSPSVFRPLPPSAIKPKTTRTPSRSRRSLPAFARTPLQPRDFLAPVESPTLTPAVAPPSPALEMFAPSPVRFPPPLSAQPPKTPGQARARQTPMRTPPPTAPAAVEPTPSKAPQPAPAEAAERPPAAFNLSAKSVSTPLSDALQKSDPLFFLGRSFRVGFSPNGALVCPSFVQVLPASTVAPLPPRDVVTTLTIHALPKAQGPSDAYLPDLTRCNLPGLVQPAPLSDPRQCPRVPRLANPEYSDSEVARFINTASKNNGGISDHARSVWELVEALWSSPKGLDGSLIDFSDDKYAEQHHRLHELTRWLEAAVAKDVQHDVEKCKGDNMAQILHLLSGRKISRASMLAIQSKDLRMAQLISQLSSPTLLTEDMREQVIQWRDAQCDRLIDAKRWDVYRLLGGDADVPSDELSWLRCFALHLWYAFRNYSEDPEQQDRVAFAVNNFLLAVKKQCATEPFAPYVEQLVLSKRKADPLFSKGRFFHDARMHLLLAYISLPEAILPDLFNPLSHTMDAFDYRLSWALFQILDGRLNLTVDEDVKKMACRLNMDFVAQLESDGKWEWAVFVALHLPDWKGSSLLRERCIRTLLERHLTPEAFSTSPILQEPIVPRAWIEHALALRSCGTDAEAAHLLSALRACPLQSELRSEIGQHLSSIAERHCFSLYFNSNDGFQSLKGFLSDLRSESLDGQWGRCQLIQTSFDNKQIFVDVATGGRQISEEDIAGLREQCELLKEWYHDERLDHETRFCLQDLMTVAGRQLLHAIELSSRISSDMESEESFNVEMAEFAAELLNSLPIFEQYKKQLVTRLRAWC